MVKQSTTTLPSSHFCLHSEIAERFKTLNFGLKPVQQRELRETLPTQMTDFQKMYSEFKAKLQEKTTKNE